MVKSCLKKIIYFCTFQIITISTYAQIIGIEHDSTITYCKYKDMKKAIKWNYSKISFSYTYAMNFMDSLRNTGIDTTFLSYKIHEGEFDSLTWRLIKKGKVSFYDKKNNKFVTNLKKVKREIKDEMLYDSYIDADTGHELWQIVTKDFHQTKF